MTSYYVGTALEAHFIGGSEVLTSPCKIDDAAIEMRPISGDFLCTSNSTLSNDEHTLTVSLGSTVEPVAFDALIIKPEQLPNEGVDIIYDMDLNSTLKNAGDSWELPFHGQYVFPFRGAR